TKQVKQGTKFMEYEVVIGLEVHAQLSTNTKIFCGCSTKFGSEPNTQTCPICLGMPGVLPVLNRSVVESALTLGVATNSKIGSPNIFARKNYFYPDLPKGFQTSQFDKPICENGYLEIESDTGSKKINIIRIHMEEDAGKSVHDETYVHDDETMIDLNRCGTPLVEIVSAPDLRSAKDAYNYLFKLRQLVRYLNICDGNMEEGSLRCDANISLRPKGETKLGTRTELKNMNSFRHVEKALEYEIARQKDLLEAGEKVEQETLLWDPDKNEARPMRGKEESHDYRYFPEPDLVPVLISEEWLKNIEVSMPELPDVKMNRFIKDYDLTDYDARIICSSLEMADYFENAAGKFKDYKMISNWMMGEISRVINEDKIEIGELKVTPERLVDILNAIQHNTISSSAAKKVFAEAVTNSDDISVIINTLGLKQVSDVSELENMIADVLKNNPEEVALYKSGTTKVLGFLVGQVMKASKGKANPGMVNQILKKNLSG
ncbi:MAG: Asp-tRNA(Asn)/Glu-tRNA(Gln) amidotransferase subunit GatB, partial [Calditrichaceae bacterium]